MTNLAKLVTKYLSTRSQHERSPGIHASEISSEYMCTRREVIRLTIDAAGLNSKPPITPKSQGIFDVGHALHEWLRHEYLGPMGILKGIWACQNCPGGVVHGYMPSVCPACGSTGYFKYDEIEVKIPEYGITGHIDGIVTLDEVDYILDIKTHSTFTWKNLSDIKEGHKRQLNIYMRAYGIHKAVCLYVCKDNMEMRSYIIDFDEDLFQTTLREGLYDLEQNFKDGILPPMDSRCKSGGWFRATCHVQGLCLGCTDVDDVNNRIKAEVPW